MFNNIRSFKKAMHQDHLVDQEIDRYIRVGACHFCKKREKGGKIE
jgi:hypothetical protein